MGTVGRLAETRQQPVGVRVPGLFVEYLAERRLRLVELAQEHVVVRNIDEVVDALRLALEGPLYPLKRFFVIS